MTVPILCFSFITGSYDRTCKVWDTASGEELHVLEGHKNVVYAIAFNNPYGYVHDGIFANWYSHYCSKLVITWLLDTLFWVQVFRLTFLVLDFCNRQESIIVYSVINWDSWHETQSHNVIIMFNNSSSVGCCVLKKNMRLVGQSCRFKH